MGLFNKTVNCARCGRPFEKGLLSSSKYCFDCEWIVLKEEMLKRSIEEQETGLKFYYDAMPKQFRGMPADFNTIIASRNKTLEKYRRDRMCNLDMLRNASVSFANWNDEQMLNFAITVMSALVDSQYFNSFKLCQFLVSHMYDGVVIDYDSVFAIAIEENYLLNVPASEQAYLCHLFTNDPYFPVLGVSFTPQAQSTGFFAESKRKQERIATLREILPKMFPNITYPIVTCKEMTNIIAQEGGVRGKLSPQFMTALLKEKCCPPFWGLSSLMPEEMPFGISYAIQDYGYITPQDVRHWLFLDDRATTEYWNPYLIRAGQEIDAAKEQLRALYNSSPELFGNNQQS